MDGGKRGREDESWGDVKKWDSPEKKGREKTANIEYNPNTPKKKKKTTHQLHQIPPLPPPPPLQRAPRLLTNPNPHRPTNNLPPLRRILPRLFLIHHLSQHLLLLRQRPIRRLAQLIPSPAIGREFRRLGDEARGAEAFSAKGTHESESRGSK